MKGFSKLYTDGVKDTEMSQESNIQNQEKCTKGWGESLKAKKYKA